MTDVTYYVEADWTYLGPLKDSLKKRGYEPEQIYVRTAERREDLYIGFLKKYLQIKVTAEEEAGLTSALRTAGRWIVYFSKNWADFQENTPAPNFHPGPEGRIPEPTPRLPAYITGASSCRLCGHTQRAAVLEARAA